MPFQRFFEGVDGQRAGARSPGDCQGQRGIAAQISQINLARHRQKSQHGRPLMTAQSLPDIRGDGCGLLRSRGRDRGRKQPQLPLLLGNRAFRFIERHPVTIRVESLTSQR